MRISAIGWNRSMGWSTIGGAEWGRIEVEKSSEDDPAYENKTMCYVGNDGITIKWKQYLRFTGHYQVDLELTNRDLIELFKARFGQKLNLETLRTMGITIDDVVPSRRELQEAVRNMSVRDFIAAISGPPGSDGVADRA